MIIGIDIDDTITDSWECLIPHYSRLFNVPEEVLHKSKPYYESIKDKVPSTKEYYKMMIPVYDEVSPNVNLLPGVKETIDALYDLGCKVIFITSRGTDHTDSYGDSVRYLDKYHIKYEKVIVGAQDKGEICEREHVSLFIDDSYVHCVEAADRGIPVLMHETYYNKEYTDITHFSDWHYVYEYVKARWYSG